MFLTAAYYFYMYKTDCTFLIFCNNIKLKINIQLTSPTAGIANDPCKVQA